jgi:hypothetical protein
MRAAAFVGLAQLRCAHRLRSQEAAPWRQR